MTHKNMQVTFNPEIKRNLLDIYILHLDYFIAITVFPM